VPIILCLRDITSYDDVVLCTSCVDNVHRLVSLQHVECNNCKKSVCVPITVTYVKSIVFKKQQMMQRRHIGAAID